MRLFAELIIVGVFPDSNIAVLKKVLAALVAADKYVDLSVCL